MLLPAVAVLSALGFVIDDALIVSRFAVVVHREGRHAFNAGGPVVDGVTPLVLPWILAPLASSVLASFAVQRIAGAAAVVVGVGFLGHALARAFGARAWTAMLVTCASFPLAVHAGSGLETGLVTGLVAASLACFLSERGSLRGAWLLGAAASLRPELVVGAFAAATPQLRVGKSWGVLARVLGPAIGTAAIRLAAFGRPFPLAVLAKPSDLTHGALYVAAGAIVSGLWVVVPALASARVEEGEGSDDRRAAQRSATLLVVAHVASVMVAGGDWMPYARLLVPGIPCMAVMISAMPSGAVRGLTCVVAMVAQLFFGWSHRAEATRVVAERLAVIERLRPALRGQRVVAGLDVGTLAASHEGRIVDLAGLTMAEVARMQGGHTSKRIPEGFLNEQEVDALVMWAPNGSEVELGPSALFGRAVETRLARSPAVRASFKEINRVAWDSQGATLIVYVRTRP